MKFVIIISTYPDSDSINKIAKQLVHSKVVACVNITKISSIYTWNGKVHDSPEYLGFFKTVIKNRDLLKEKIRETHPYDVPEIVEIDATAINKPYYDWLVESTFIE